MEDILLLVHRIPFPPDKGEKIRAYHLLRHLARTHRVHLGCFVDDPHDLQHTDALKELCATVFVVGIDRKVSLARGLAALALGSSLSQAYFRDSRMARWTSETMARVNPSSIFVFCSAMAQYALPYAQSHRVIVDMVDVDSEKYRAYAESSKWPMKGLYLRESLALLRMERHTAKVAERSFFVSRAEADAFLAAAPEAKGKVGYFQNGVNYRHFDPALAFISPFAGQSSAIVFTGTMDYRPNIEAVEWFAKSCFPAIAQSHPSAQFWIVGANPSAGVNKLAREPGIRVTGRVPDVRPYLAHAACIVAPLHIARGVQNKVLEAMAMARPVVATPAACEGLSAIPGRDLVVAESPEQFHEAVCSVLTGKTADMGTMARRLIVNDYEWSKNLAVLDNWTAPNNHVRFEEMGRRERQAALREVSPVP
jgi:sugar transferase (PEP-CTERM/EpsH1 system associated)